MDSLRTILRRDNTGNDDNDNDGLSQTTIELLISLLVLILISLTLIGAYLVIRRRKQRQSLRNSELPMYHDQRSRNTRRLTITASSIFDEKRSRNASGGCYSSSASPPPSPVPEIRITFPEEEDASTGKRQSGRVVVVRISEKGSVGLEPYDEELPPYQSRAGEGEGFQSLDLERLGGLKEKDRVRDEKRWS
ncbi:hypothetical protein PAAG_04626 [Paracoccidioides lutzii Pb01]|uniref:Uncharacterized protein n=1 Tax=Paracoccidioides lutzii (strain ATCC MYA-826 / Pb01) TaxID=502779 RepID=C1H1I2_PARBA|nr:hypothetical protein PAAG_04626 [Paracoccidioides lutzii Pb01]EEH33575.1 hypothetical protein PAAG_04626 [Paracoccidioides lutzii Pb01]